MYEIILTIDVIAAIAIVVLVLLQQGKGADMGVSFGGGASNTVFGSKGAASFLFKATVFFTGLFFVCCLTLGYLGKTPTAATTAVSSDNADKSIASQYDQYQQEAAAASTADQGSKPSSK